MENAFVYTGPRDIVSFVVPEGVTSIGRYAFSDCDSLNNIIIPEGVVSIGNSAFDNCISLTNINLPNSVTTIGQFVFLHCRSLRSINLSNSRITSIEFSAFYGCRSLSSITLPNSLTIIKDLAFQGCISLTSITLPNSLTVIGQGAFAQCISLSSINLPNNLTSIGYGRIAFLNCFNLQRVIIETNDVHGSFNCQNSITELTFKGCGDLRIVIIKINGVDKLVFRRILKEIRGSKYIYIHLIRLDYNGQIVYTPDPININLQNSIRSIFRTGQDVLIEEKTVEYFNSLDYLPIETVRHVFEYDGRKYKKLRSKRRSRRRKKSKSKSRRKRSYKNKKKSRKY